MEMLQTVHFCHQPYPLHYYIVFQLPGAPDEDRLYSQPAFRWGELELALVKPDVLSFVRYAFGTQHKRYLVAANLGDEVATHSYSHLHTGGIKTKETGFLVYSFCPGPSGLDIRYENSRMVALESLTLEPGCGAILQVEAQTMWYENDVWFSDEGMPDLSTFGIWKVWAVSSRNIANTSDIALHCAV